MSNPARKSNRPSKRLLVAIKAAKAEVRTWEPWQRSYDPHKEKDDE